MIDRYSDHSANERTYLAWIRTALGIMAFGFLIEKFDLFVSSQVSIEKPDNALVSAELVGLGFFTVGVFIIVNATVRFYMLKRLIDSDQHASYSLRIYNVVLLFLMIALAVFLLVYMSHKILI
jgi:putative membrane protein